jgi:hypothetical protein
MSLRTVDFWLAVIKLLLAVIELLLAIAKFLVVFNTRTGQSPSETPNRPSSLRISTDWVGRRATKGPIEHLLPRLVVGSALHRRTPITAAEVGYALTSGAGTKGRAP